MGLLQSGYFSLYSRQSPSSKPPEMTNEIFEEGSKTACIRIRAHQRIITDLTTWVYAVMLLESGLNEQLVYRLLTFSSIDC